MTTNISEVIPEQEDARHQDEDDEYDEEYWNRLEEYGRLHWSEDEWRHWNEFNGDDRYGWGYEFEKRMNRTIAKHDEELRTKTQRT